MARVKPKARGTVRNVAPKAGAGKSVISSSDLQAGYNPPPELREAGIEIEDIEVVPEHAMETAIATEKFMNEKVLVEIESDPDDENAPIFVYLGHNGVSQYVKRGEPQAVKRKFLYSALMSKRVKFGCSFGKDGQGNEFNRLSPNAATTHRITLVRDDNPQGGMKWVQSVMRQAA